MADAYRGCATCAIRVVRNLPEFAKERIQDGTGPLIHPTVHTILTLGDRVDERAGTVFAHTNRQRYSASTGKCGVL